MGRNTLKYELTKSAVKGLVSTRTIKVYKTGCREFANYCKENGIKDVMTATDEQKIEYIQSYERHLEERGMSPSTIHTRVAPICRATKIKMNKIDKPHRTSDQITRSRTSWKNEQGINQRDNDKYDRVVKAEEAIGCRRSELERLRVGNCIRFDNGKPADWIRDESGHICVEICSGKGGKYQLQRIDPDRLAQLRDVIETCKGGPDPHAKLFSSQEMANKLDLHGIRGEVARDMYDRYAAHLQSDPAYRDQLRQELIDRYDRYNNPARKNAEKHRERFMRDITNEKPYLLRGSNKEVALANDRPIQLDRLAIMAVSVFHLSHWRADVTVTSYLLGR